MSLGRQIGDAGLFYFMSLGDESSAEMDDHRGRRDSETLRDAEAIRSDAGRLKMAMRHLQHARNAMDRFGVGPREIRGKKRKGRRD